jgi:DNA repair exonuclease SbcCD ATPase subunit
MSKKGKSAVLFVILLLLLSLGATSFYYVSFENQKKKSIELEGKFNRAQEEKKTIELKLKNINEEKKNLEIKIKTNQDLISELNDKLSQEIRSRELFKQEQESLRSKVIELTEDKKSLREALDEKLREISALQSQLSSTLADKVKLEEKMEKLPLGKEGAVDLEKIVVVPSGTNELGKATEEDLPETKESIKVEPKKELVEATEQVDQKPPLSGEVLLINKEYNFLVLSLGEVDGAVQGDVFEISREGTALGQVRLEKVHKNMSAANFLPGLIANQVKEGDVANRIY